MNVSTDVASAAPPIPGPGAPATGESTRTPATASASASTDPGAEPPEPGDADGFAALFAAQFAPVAPIPGTATQAAAATAPQAMSLMNAVPGTVNGDSSKDSAGGKSMPPSLQALAASGPDGEVPAADDVLASGASAQGPKGIATPAGAGLSADGVAMPGSVVALDSGARGDASRLLLDNLPGGRGNVANPAPVTTDGSSPVPVSGPSNAAAPSGTTLTPGRQVLDLPVPPRDPGFGAALGERVVWLARRDGPQQAEIRLNPPELGSLLVRVTVSNGEAQVHFSAAHAQTREALEGAMARLRESFEEGGLTLTDASVSDQSTDSRGDGTHPDDDPAGFFGSSSVVDDAVAVTPHASTLRSGLLDDFA